MSYCHPNTRGRTAPLKDKRTNRQANLQSASRAQLSTSLDRHGCGNSQHLAPRGCSGRRRHQTGSWRAVPRSRKSKSVQRSFRPLSPAKRGKMTLVLCCVGSSPHSCIKAVALMPAHEQMWCSVEETTSSRTVQTGKRASRKEGCDSGQGTPGPRRMRKTSLLKLGWL